MSSRRRTARKLRRTANTLSASRIAAAPLLFERIYSGHSPSWWLCSTLGLLAASDKYDGVLARKAQKLAPDMSDTTGAWLDQMADKALVHGVLGGLVVQQFAQENYWLGTVYAASQAATLARDSIVTRIRKRATDKGQSTNAQRLGKWKAGLQLASLGYAVSPLVRYSYGTLPVGEIVAASGVGASAIFSVASGVSLAHHLQQQEQK